MDYENSKNKGDEAELAVLIYLKRRKYNVSIPFGENAPYDLIAESPKGNLYRIQVRWVSWKDDTLCLSLRRISKNYHKTLDRSRINTFAVWDGSDVYFIPVEATMTCKNAFSIRKVPPGNGQEKGVHMAATYQDAVSFIS